MESGDVAGALAVFRRALAFEPSSPELLTRVDALLREQGSPEERLALHRAALEQASDPARRRELYHAIGAIERRDLGDAGGGARHVPARARRAAGRSRARSTRCSRSTRRRGRGGTCAPSSGVLWIARRATSGRRSCSGSRRSRPRTAGSTRRRRTTARSWRAPARPPRTCWPRPSASRARRRQGAPAHGLRAARRRGDRAAGGGHVARAARRAAPGRARRRGGRCRRVPARSGLGGDGRRPDARGGAARARARRRADGPRGGRAAARAPHRDAEAWERLPAVYVALLRAASSAAEAAGALLAFEAPALRAGVPERFLAEADALLERTGEGALGAAERAAVRSARARVLGRDPARFAEAAAAYRAILESGDDASGVEAHAFDALLAAQGPSGGGGSALALRVPRRACARGRARRPSCSPGPRPRRARSATPRPPRISMRGWRRSTRRTTRRSRRRRGCCWRRATSPGPPGSSSGAARSPTGAARAALDLELAALLLDRLDRAAEALARIAPVLDASPTDEAARRLVERALARPEARRKAAELLERVADATEDPDAFAALLGVLLATPADDPALRPRGAAGTSGSSNASRGAEPPPRARSTSRWPRRRSCPARSRSGSAPSSSPGRCASPSGSRSPTGARSGSRRSARRARRGRCPNRLSRRATRRSPSPGSTRTPSRRSGGAPSSTTRSGSTSPRR